MVKYALLSLGVAGLLMLGEGLAPQVTWPTGQQERFVVRVPEDFSTIQAAIDAVAEGGTVLIGPGTYQESIQMSKSIRLRGASQELVQIQSVDHGSVTIDIDSEKPIQVSLEDFTVKNRGFLSSRGIRVWGNVQVLMERLIVSGYEDGDGIMLSNKSAFPPHVYGPQSPIIALALALAPAALLFYVSGGVIFTGRDNEIRDNGKGDLCPADYPWPAGFKK
jgi:hypothetical protein